MFDLIYQASVPINGDGEVDAFMLMKAEDAVSASGAGASGSRTRRVMLDFAMRWGYMWTTGTHYGRDLRPLGVVAVVRRPT